MPNPTGAAAARAARTQPIGLPREIAPPDLSRLDRHRLEAMGAAGDEVAECMRVLRKANLNLVGEVLKGQGQFFRLGHYPKGDVFDRETHSQYYYHAHRDGEHGHFHCFLRGPGMPEGATPVPEAEAQDWPRGANAVAHLVAVSMDRFGTPIRLFTTNQWVTGETWYPAADVIAMLDRFAIDHAWPSWPTNRWLTAMVRLFRPQIEALVEARDAVLAEARAARPDADLYADRDLETLSEVAIDVEAQRAAVRAALD
jgi:hypothetical protein